VARRHQHRFVRLVDRFPAESTGEVVGMITAGLVTVDGVVMANPAALVAADAVVAVLPERVLRGTVKLRAALDRFGVSVSGRVCLDVGAAAGGFTMALLEAGARRVYAVDVGYGQLVGRLRQDRRVVNLERTNLANLDAQLIPGALDVISLDLSYLALSQAIPQLGSLELSAKAQLIALVKPTFELHASSMVVESEAVDKATASAKAAAESCGWSIDERSVPVRGGGGAPEVFICGTRRAKGEPAS
jgi:23S rRNA (cytidine1920-2'-O)/16S rRNA (cytidine1409-2'-O)-methyltransferase